MSATERAGDDAPHVVPSTEADEIARRIEKRQTDLAADVDELATRVHPKTLVRTTGESAKDKARAAVLTEDGKPRVERIAAVGSAVLVVVGALLMKGRKHRRD